MSSSSDPGGNVTGVSYIAQTLLGKRLELLKQLAPATEVFGLLVNPGNSEAGTQIREAEAAAHSLSLRLVIENASTPDEIAARFANLTEQRIGALVMGVDPLIYFQRTQIAALALRHSIPVVGGSREFAEAGNLISYGTSLAEAYRIAGTYTGRILKGEKPSDLPVQNSSKIELVVNLKTARALGLTIPISLLGRADEVIE